MRVVTCICLALAALSLAGGAATAASPSGGPATSPAVPSQASPQPGTGKPQGAKPATAARPAQPASHLGERRRRSYASCNRESHRRELHGGARRRFLIRCKLGLERRGSGPSAAPGGPPQPGKHP